MSILHSPRRDEHLPQGYLLLEQTINFNLFYDFTEEDFGHSAKKINTFRTAFNLSGGQTVWKNVFFCGFDTILHICSDCDESTFESSAKKSPMGSPNCLVHFRMKDSNEMTFFRTFHIQIFSQTLSGKYPAVVWKPIFTRADEPMKNEVLIRSSLIHRSFRNLKKIFRV